VTLSFDEIGMRVRAHIGFAAEPPGRMSNITKATRFDCFTSEPERFRLAVIKVDCKEQTSLFGLRQQLVCLREIER